MKSNIEKVYSKLPKTELSKVELETQKVELALVDDFKKTIGEFNKSRTDGQGDLFKALEMAKKSIGSLTKAKKDGENSLKQYNKILKAAEDIGVNIPTTVSKAGEQTEDLLKGVDKMLKAAKSMNSAI
tara:strand:- start:297 stop:680 length:384 start_codon:yes stop_codon:yes gene_type:complete